MVEAAAVLFSFSLGFFVIFRAGPFLKTLSQKLGRYHRITLSQEQRLLPWLPQKDPDSLENED